MVAFAEEHKIALISCVETVLMSRGGPNYHLTVAKLNSLYDCTILDCYEHPDYLRTVLKDVYKEEYNSIIDEIKLQLDELIYEKDLAQFFKTMES
ncbi:MAG: hypothetical protein ACREA3_02610 [Nitrosotalea sp.]